MRILSLLPLALLLTGCPSKRVLALENHVLREQVRTLEDEVDALRGTLPDLDGFERDVDLSTVHRFLERAGYHHTWTPDARHVRMEYGGRNTSFTVQIQHFESADVLFIGTRNYLRLEEAQGVESVVLLLVQLATLNYDVLVGKFQLNQESGEILVSAEIPVADGLGYEAFIETVDALCRTADARYPELARAALGLGL